MSAKSFEFHPRSFTDLLSIKTKDNFEECLFREEIYGYVQYLEDMERVGTVITVCALDRESF